MSGWTPSLPPLAPADLLAASNWIILVGVLISIAEQAFSHREYKDNDVFDWYVHKHSHAIFLKPRFEPFFDFLFGYRMYLVNLALQATMVAASAIALWQGGSTVFMTGALLVLILLAAFRNTYGHDGADQMTTIVLGGLLVAGFAPESQLVQATALGFIGLQSILSYVTAGAYKAIAPSWRDGSSLTLVMSTRSYGRPDLSGVLERNPPISRSLSILLIAFECLFFLVLFTGPYGALVFLAGGVIFHFLNAAIMGLNNFFWAFTASYPGVYFCALLVSGWLYG